MDAIAHGQLDNFTLEQLGLFITLLLGGVGGLLAIIFKSRCKKVKCCCIECDRDVILPTLTGESDISSPPDRNTRTQYPDESSATHHTVLDIEPDQHPASLSAP